MNHQVFHGGSCTFSLKPIQWMVDGEKISPISSHQLILPFDVPRKWIWETITSNARLIFPIFVVLMPLAAEIRRRSEIGNQFGMATPPEFKALCCSEWIEMLKMKKWWKTLGSRNGRQRNLLLCRKCHYFRHVWVQNKAAKTLNKPQLHTVS